MKTIIDNLHLVRRSGSVGVALEKGGEMIVWCDAPEDRTAKAGWTAILAALDNGIDAESRPVNRRVLPGYAVKIRAALRTA
jgi:hypothetical protein